MKTSRLNLARALWFLGTLVVVFSLNSCANGTTNPSDKPALEGTTVPLAPVFAASGILKSISRVAVDASTFTPNFAAMSYYQWFCPNVRSFTSTSGWKVGGTYSVTILGTAVPVTVSQDSAKNFHFVAVSADQTVSINVTYYPALRTFDYEQCLIVQMSGLSTWSGIFTSQMVVRGTGIPVDSSGYSHSLMDYVVYAYGTPTGKSQSQKITYWGTSEYYSDSRIAGWCIHTMGQNYCTTSDGGNSFVYGGDPMPELAALGPSSLELVPTLESMGAKYRPLATTAYALGYREGDQFSVFPSAANGLSTFANRAEAQSAATTAAAEWIVLPEAVAGP